MIRLRQGPVRPKVGLRRQLRRLPPFAGWPWLNLPLDWKQRALPLPSRRPRPNSLVCPRRTAGHPGAAGDFPRGWGSSEAPLEAALQRQKPFSRNHRLPPGHGRPRRSPRHRVKRLPRARHQRVPLLPLPCCQRVGHLRSRPPPMDRVCGHRRRQRPHPAPWTRARRPWSTEPSPPHFQPPDPKARPR